MLLIDRERKNDARMIETERMRGKGRMIGT
jgi:hypothetical protein